MSRRKDPSALTIALFATLPIPEARALLSQCKAVVDARATAPGNPSSGRQSKRARAGVAAEAAGNGTTSTTS